jgi:hypothetical protein
MSFDNLPEHNLEVGRSSARRSTPVCASQYTTTANIGTNRLVQSQKGPEIQNQDSLGKRPREQTQSTVSKLAAMLGMGSSGKPPNYDHHDCKGIIASKDAEILYLTNELNQKEMYRSEWETYANSLMSGHTYFENMYNESETLYKELAHRYEQLEATEKALNAENIKYRNQLQQQAAIIAKNEKEMRQLQEAEFAAHSKPVVSQNHEKMASNLEDLFNAVTKWSRVYFKASKVWAGCSFDSLHEAAPSFAKLLRNSSHNAKSLIDGSQCPKIQFLVEAVVNQFLILNIFTKPFNFCEPETGEVCALIFKNLKKGK